MIGEQNETIPILGNFKEISSKFPITETTITQNINILTLESITNHIHKTWKIEKRDIHIDTNMIVIFSWPQQDKNIIKLSPTLIHKTEILFLILKLVYVYIIVWRTYKFVSVYLRIT